MNLGESCKPKKSRHKRVILVNCRENCSSNAMLPINVLKKNQTNLLLFLDGCCAKCTKASHRIYSGVYSLLLSGKIFLMEISHIRVGICN